MFDVLGSTVRWVHVGGVSTLECRAAAVPLPHASSLQIPHSHCDTGFVGPDGISPYA